MTLTICFQETHYVTTTCSQVGVVCKYINYLYSEEGSTLCIYGNEGEGMEYDADGNPQFTQLITDNPDGIPAKVASCIYVIGDGAPIPHFTTYIKRLVNYSDEQYAAFDVWSTSGYENNYPLGATLSSEESEESSQLLSDISTYVTENVTKFIVGQRSMAEYEDFLADIEAMNIGRVIELYQAAYDRYLLK